MMLLFYHIKETTLTCTLSYGRIALFNKRILFKLNVSLTEIILRWVAVKRITKPLYCHNGARYGNCIAILL